MRRILLALSIIILGIQLFAWAKERDDLTELVLRSDIIAIGEVSRGSPETFTDYTCRVSYWLKGETKEKTIFVAKRNAERSAIPKDKCILFLEPFYVGDKEFYRVRDLYNGKEESSIEGIFAFSEAKASEIQVVINELAQAKEAEAANRGKLKEALQLHVSVKKIERGKEQEIRAVTFENTFKNISDKPLYFYLETCEIDFWGISINGGEFTAMSCAMHNHPCPFLHVVKLMPAETRVLETILGTCQPLAKENNFVKIRYYYNEDKNNRYIESNQVNID